MAISTRFSKGIDVPIQSHRRATSRGRSGERALSAAVTKRHCLGYATLVGPRFAFLWNYPIRTRQRADGGA